MDHPLQDLSHFAHKNILIVDDEPAIHEMFGTVLRPEAESAATFVEEGETMVDSSAASHNFDLHNSFGGEDALSICKAQSNRRAPIQMAFVDMRMEGWNGIETIQQLNEFDPRMSFVMVTGFPEQTREAVENELGAIAIQIFPKPIQLDELYKAAYALTNRWNRLHGDN